MGSIVAILQTDPNLMRCQIRRLEPVVSLQEGDLEPDAYGFGHYGDGRVLVGKRPAGAPAALGLADLVGRVTSEALVVHARRSSVGRAKDENTPPFRFRSWIFAHAGPIQGFAKVKGRLLEELPDFLRRSVLGDTDSEHAFMWFLKLLRDANRLDDPDLDAPTAGRALAATIRRIESWRRDAGEPAPSRLAFLATNGRILVAARRGAPLHYALLEGIVPCALDAIEAGTPESDPRVRPHRRVKAVAFASRLRQQAGFQEVPDGSVVAVSRGLEVSVTPIGNGE